MVRLSLDRKGFKIGMIGKEVGLGCSGVNSLGNGDLFKVVRRFFVFRCGYVY